MTHITQTPSRSSVVAVLGTVIALCLLSIVPAGAEIAEPHHVLYGRATQNGAILDPGARISLEVEGQEITSFLFGSNPESPELYILRIPLDTVGERPAGLARSGDRAEIFIDGELVSVVQVGAAGRARNLDIDPVLLTAAIHIDNVQLFEGHSGNTVATLTVSINQPSAVAVEVDYTTRDDSAVAGSDYMSRLGRVTIPAGETSRTVDIQIIGDTVAEADEVFHVDLSNPINGVLFDHEALITVLDDDTPPSLQVTDVVVAEPNPGATLESAFTVRLSHSWSQDVSFNYAAVDLPGQASNGADYILGAGSGLIAAGQLTTEIPFTVLGDIDDELDEVFQVHLSNATNASILDGVGQGSLNDFVRFLRYLEHTVQGAPPAVAGSVAPGLAGAYDVDISPDGLHVYVAGRGSDAVVAFERGPDGALTHLATYEEGADGIDGLHDVEVVHVSADGTKVFAASYDANALVSFLRQPDGTLVFVDQDFDGLVDPESTRVVQGLAGAAAIAEAPGSDGHPDHLYVAGQLDDSVAVFQVLADGKLEYETVVKDGTAGVDGLAQASAIAIGPDGSQVYVTGFLDDSVAVFDRNVDDGFLAFRQLHRNGVSGVFALDGAVDLVLSADGAHLYVAGLLSSGVAVFDRNPSNGLLTFTGGVLDGVGGNEGLGFVTGLALSRNPALGDFLYATSFTDHAISIFERMPDGSLLFEDFVRDGIGGVDGLDGANALVVSPDDQNVYAVGTSASSLTVFSRDIVPPAPLALTSTTHTVGVPSNLTTVGLQWSGASDEGFGVADYWLLLDVIDDTPAPTGPPSLFVLHTTDPHSAELVASEDDDNYFVHVTTCDLIGNCSPTHLGPLAIDTTPPTLPGGLTSPSHGSPNTDPRITMSWSPAIDPPAASGYASGLAGYSWAYRTTDTPECDGAVEGTGLSVTSPILPVGSHYFHLCSVDVAGNPSPIAISAPLVIEEDLVAPSVALIDTVSRTESGAIVADQVLNNAITQFSVTFSESIGTGVVDPTSYRLVESGADEVPSLAACDGVLGDDTELPVAAVTYLDGTRTAYLDLAGNGSVAAGNYRLLVCSVLADLQGNALNGGVDFVLDFGVAGSYLANPNFDDDLTQWTLSNGSIAAFLADDADDAPTSGSLGMLITEQAERASQCVELPAFPTYAEIGLSARARITQRSATVVTAQSHLRFYDQPGCQGVELSMVSSLENAGDTGGLWIDLDRRAALPASTLSVEVVFEAVPQDLAGDADVAFDRGALVALPPLFTDGFESGDLTGWGQ